MPEIAFYIGLKNNRSAIEGAELDKGNPGVGGTQYLFLITVIMLNRLYGSNYALLLTDVCFSNADRCLVTEYAENEGYLRQLWTSCFGRITPFQPKDKE